MRRFSSGFAALLLSATFAQAQNFATSPCHGDEGESHSSWIFGHNERACEVRTAVLPLVNGQLNVSGKNGGIEVIGEDRRDIALEAKVTAQGSSHDDAAARLRAIRIVTNPDIHSEGPDDGGMHRYGWTVEYKLRVPRHLAANLRTMNGAIELAGIDGAVHAQTTNGGLSLRDLAGDVHAETVNGGVELTLAGNKWRGNGLYARSTNGGVSVKVPDHFGAHLVASTVNGGLDVGFPVTVQGKIHKSIDTDINGGGPTVHLETVNGGVSIDRM